MKIAIPLFDTRISPRFGYAQTMLIAEIAGNSIISRDIININNATWRERIKKLVEMGIDTLICGGINMFAVEELHHIGMNVYTCVTGEADDALECLKNGELESGIMLGSGGQCNGHWRFRGREHGPWSQKINSKIIQGGVEMPRGDGTGPAGKGPMTGDGKGACKGSAKGKGRGSGQGKGSGQGRNADSNGG